MGQKYKMNHGGTNQKRRERWKKEEQKTKKKETTNYFGKVAYIANNNSIIFPFSLARLYKGGALKSLPG